MMRELNTSSDYPIFNSSFPLIRAVLLKLQEGRIFSNTEDNLFFVFHKSTFSYLRGFDTIDYPGVVNFFLASNELPNYFHIYDAADKLVDVCIRNKDMMNIKVRKRIRLKFMESKLTFAYELPKKYTINKIDASSFGNLSNFGLSLESKFWRSREDFLKNGFGFTVNDTEGLPVSICYSAGVADGIAEIDVATIQQYQNMGLAKSVVAHFVRYCLDNKLIPNWDCFDNNYGSLRTAERIGFKYIDTYNFLSIFNKTRNHESE